MIVAIFFCRLPFESSQHPQTHKDILSLNKNEETFKIAEGDEGDVAEQKIMLLDVIVDPYLKVIQSGGVEIVGLDASFVNRRRSPFEPVLEIHKFVPHFPTTNFSYFDMAKFCTNLALENAPSLRVTLVEIDENDDKNPLSEFFQQALEKFPLIVSDVNYLTEKEIELNDVTVKNESLSSFNGINFLIKSNCIMDPTFLSTAYDKLDANGFVLSRESSKFDNLELPENFKHIASISMDGVNGFSCLNV